MQTGPRPSTLHANTLSKLSLTAAKQLDLLFGSLEQDTFTCNIKQFSGYEI